MALRVGNGRGPFARATQGGSTPPPISCAFPLDADVTPYGFAQMTMTDDSQTGSFVIPAGTSSEYLAAPSTQTLGATAGAKAIGMSLPAFPATPAEGQAVQSRLQLRSAVLAELYSMGVTRNPVGITLSVLDGSGNVLESAGGLSGVPTVFAVPVAAGSEIRFFYRIGEGALVELTPQAYSPQAIIPTLRGVSIDANGSITGQTVSAKLLSAAPDLSALAGMGFTDNCGTEIT